MAETSHLPTVLTSFTTATDAALRGLPDVDKLIPPKDGISLLDTKNEIFLSYLQGLALRNLNVVRSLKYGRSSEDIQRVSDGITRKLVEHRVYLERGVRPLEQKLKFQVDRMVKAAEDEERTTEQKSKTETALEGPLQQDNDEDGSEDSSDDEEDSGDETSYRPNAAGIQRPRQSVADDARRAESKGDGVYRPPRISATSMPTTESRERKERKPGRSAAVDEYITTEYSSAPFAEPSIGSTIASGGRKNKDAKQLAKEQERRDYEEANLLRLPKESKSEQAKQAARDKRGGFGGEEWRELGDSVDRIGSLTKRGKDSALEKSRKRRAVEDGPRGDGVGNAFELKRRRVMKKHR